MNPQTEFALSPGWALLLNDAGISADNVLRRAGLRRDLFTSGRKTITIDECFALWEGIEAESGDPLLPLAIGQAISSESFEPPLFAATCSPNLNVAARRLAQHKKLIGPMRLAVTKGPAWTVAFAARDATRPFLTANDRMWDFFEPELRRRLSETEAGTSLEERVRGAADETSERATGNRSMVGHRECRDVPFPGQDDVAPTLTSHLPAELPEGADHLTRAKNRDRGHQTRTSTSRVVTINGRPFSARTSRHSLIASLMLTSASSALLPWLIHPGTDGHSATYMPSSS